MRHIPRRRFGQNFLTDQSVINSLLEAISPQAADTIVEIGPGLGALTKPLLARLPHLHVVEIDRDIVAWMQQQHPSDKLTIHNVDALKFDFSSTVQSTIAVTNTASTDRQRIRIVGNLPYNISTPILFHLLNSIEQIADMHFMLQKEVVERMVAAPSTPEYGRLSVMLQYHLQLEYLLTVAPEAFEPAPKVESAFVRAIPYTNPPYLAKDEKQFAKVVLKAFGQRRKTLRNTLRGLLDDVGFKKLDINPQLRAENLSVAQFVSIANQID